MNAMKILSPVSIPSFSCRDEEDQCDERDEDLESGVDSELLICINHI